MGTVCQEWPPQSSCVQCPEPPVLGTKEASGGSRLVSAPGWALQHLPAGLNWDTVHSKAASTPDC